MDMMSTLSKVWRVAKELGSEYKGEIVQINQVSAHALIGVELKISAADFGGLRDAGCDHQFDLDDSNFCPYCGIPVQQAEKTARFASETSVEELIDTLEKSLPKDYIIAISHDKRVFIGLGTTTYKLKLVNALWPIDDSEIIEKVLRKSLDAYGLYNDATFGFYNVLSY
jgi:hypothetical protein